MSDVIAQVLTMARRLYQAGELREAKEFFGRVLAAEATNAEALSGMGRTCHRLCQFDEAIGHYHVSLQIESDRADTHSNLANALLSQGRLQQAWEHTQKALKLSPQFADAHFTLGNVLYSQGKLDDALESYRQALLLKPDYVAAHNGLGNALNSLGKVGEALASYREALRLEPEFAPAHYNLGNALRAKGLLDEAVASYREAVRLNPNNPEVHSNLGVALHEQERFDEAHASFQEAIVVNPGYAPAYNNLGLLFFELRRMAEAEASYREALRVNPESAQAHDNLGMLLLLKGDFARGWPEREWRWRTRQLKPAFRQFSQPLWQGAPLPEGTILLHAEQGFGDTLQFIRFAALVKERVGTVLCECPQPLVRLLRTCPGIDHIVPSGEPLPVFDVHAPLMSLPGILKTTLQTVPAAIPYLFADAPLMELWENELRSLEAFKIGIVWQGNPRPWDRRFLRSDQNRSIPLRHFEPLARVPGVQLVSLQKGHGTEQLMGRDPHPFPSPSGRGGRGEGSGIPIVDMGSKLDDFADTAAVMEHLDLVISADTSPAHLAGALGVPVWVALPYVSCWRWLTHREDSPWYPTMRLFRQKSPGDWPDVFERMAAALRDVVEGSKEPCAGSTG